MIGGHLMLAQEPPRDRLYGNGPSAGADGRPRETRVGSMKVDQPGTRAGKRAKQQRQAKMRPGLW
jgi:hypothetical protein